MKGTRPFAPALHDKIAWTVYAVLAIGGLISSFFIGYKSLYILIPALISGIIAVVMYDYPPRSTEEDKE